MLGGVILGPGIGKENSETVTGTTSTHCQTIIFIVLYLSFHLMNKSSLFNKIFGGIDFFCFYVKNY